MFRSQLVCLIAAVLGCAGSAHPPSALAVEADPAAPADALAVATPLYIPGEYMAWDLTWRDITGGRSELVVGEPGLLPDGRSALIVKSTSRSDGVLAMFRHVQDSLQTTVDLGTSLPIAHQGEFEFGKKPGGEIKASRIETSFDNEMYAVVYERRDRRPIRFVRRVPRGERVYDTHAVLGALRAWAPQPGTRAYFYGLSGRRLYKVHLVFAGQEEIRTGMGKHRAVRIDGIAQRLKKNLEHDTRRKPRRFSLWISDDDRRVPLLVEAKTEYGPVKVELSEYDRPQPRVAHTR